MTQNKQISIFIVEDNKIFTLALKADIESAFMNMPIKIRSFETGEKFMEMFIQEAPELVILDYSLNSKYADAADGITVLDCIKKENPDTHVIMLTGDDNIDIALKSFQHGASDYVVKTQTQFKKINYSLLNIFKIMEAKSKARRYKRLLIALFLFIAFLFGAAIAIQLYAC